MADNSDQILHFHEYFKVIRNRLWVIFTIFTLTVLSGYYVTNEVLQKTYSATSEIKILPREVTPIPTPSSGKTDAEVGSQEFQNEFEVITSPDVLSPIITDLQLDKVWAKRFKSPYEALPMQDALGYMNGILHLDYKRGTSIITITVSSEVPKECSDIANAVANRYKTMRDVAEEQLSNSGINVLKDQISQQEKIVEDQTTKVEQMRQDLYKNKGITFDSGVSEATTQRKQGELDDRTRELQAAKLDYDARMVLLNKIINLPDDEFISTLDGLGRNQGDIATLRSEIAHEQTDITNLLADGFDLNHPRVVSMQAEIDAKKKQLSDLIAGLRRSMQVDADMAQSRIQLLQKEVDTLTKDVTEQTTDDLVPFHDAQRQLDVARNMLDALRIKLQQDQIDVTMHESPVVIISLADPPEYPTSPKKSLNMIVSIAAGLFVGVGVAFLIEYLDTSVKTMADAETLLGLPVLTVIPNKGGPMPLIQDAGRLPHAEGYRILRAKLDLKVQNGIGPALTMLSGGPGEGKSTTIYNLAIVCAQAGQSVILVDCDLRRPTLHELVGVSNERGLSNYLRGEGEAVEFIQRSAMPKLQILAAGNMPMSDIGVLAGDKIRHMLDDLKQRYDLVLIDAPPVLGISDGSIIAREVDYVILVIQHRRYPREISLRAKRAIEEVHGNCVGMVLNCVAVKSDDSYYYYSSYGSYYKNNKKKDRSKKKDMDAAGTNGKHAPMVTRKADLDSDEF
jgi:capsular exopolysaccharide synthesis family protein